VATALAHPLGNFTVNRYSRLELSPEQVRVRYVVDMAEIPTFQAMPALDANGDGLATAEEQETYGARLATLATPNLHLTLDGTRVPLQVVSHEVALAPGQAGLQTLRFSMWLDAPGAAGILARMGRQGIRLEFRDENEPARIGWREIAVKAEGLAISGGAGALAQDVSDELRSYPEDLLASPLNVRQVSLTVRPDAGPAGTQPAPLSGTGETGMGAVARSPSMARASDGLAEVLAGAAGAGLTPGLVLAALLTAVVLGGMHAMSPGHGKTIVGAYLVGARGTPQHALFLGITVTAVHTAGVFALGLVTLYASQGVAPERVYPWLSLLSGLLVFGIGASLVRSRWTAARSPAPASATLTHDHGLGRHTHVLPGASGAPVTWRSLVALGVSGGLLPCPSALVVMLGAIALQQVAFGLLLIVAFSVGLAGTLMAVGLLMVYSGRAAGRLPLLQRLGAGRQAWLSRLGRRLPVASAAVVALAGLVLTADAAQHVDVPVVPGDAWLRLLAPLGLAGLVAAAAVAAARRHPRPAEATVVSGLGRLAGHDGHDHGHGHRHRHSGGHAHEHEHRHGDHHAHGHDHEHDPAHGHDHDPDHDHDHGHHPARGPGHGRGHEPSLLAR
jgi:ABC-type nickel/cobalt efflux system permease component RcnA